MAISEWTAKPYVATKCKLGEGPYYREESNEIRFMDINSHKIHIVDLTKGPESLRTIDTGMPVGVTADIKGETDVILTGAKDGVTRFDLKTGKHEYIAKFWSGEGAETKASRMRANDGSVDSEGRFWVEAFEDPEIKDPEEVGVLFRLDPDGQLKFMQNQMAIPNGISWNSNNDTMFLTDTTVKNINAFDYDAKTGEISNRRNFFHYDGEGNPDGHSRDVEGNIWQAMYGGSKVIRISPEGKITGEISLPTRNPTCPAFVGTELYITTAIESEPDEYPESAKYAGNLFHVDVGVRGMPTHKAKLR